MFAGRKLKLLKNYERSCEFSRINRARQAMSSWTIGGTARHDPSRPRECHSAGRDQFGGRAVAATASGEPTPRLGEAAGQAASVGESVRTFSKERS